MQDWTWHIWKAAYRLAWKQVNAQHALYWTHLMPQGILCIISLTLHLVIPAFRFVVRVDLLFMLSRIIIDRWASIFHVLNVIWWYLDGCYLCNFVCCLDADSGFSHSFNEVVYLSRARCWPHFVNDPIAVHPHFFKWDPSCSRCSHCSYFIDSRKFYERCKPILHVYDVNDLSKTIMYVTT